MSRPDGQVIPQLELGPRLGGLKVLFQRSNMITGLITMFSAMSAAWSTTPVLREVFGSFAVFALTAGAVLAAWMTLDYTVLLPSEQSFNQGQSQRPERSPLKRDTEEIKTCLERLETVRADGGDDDDTR